MLIVPDKSMAQEVCQQFLSLQGMKVMKNTLSRTIVLLLFYLVTKMSTSYCTTKYIHFTDEYALMKHTIFKKYQRPCTVLILGDHCGELAFKIARELNAIVMVLESDESNSILNLCIHNKPDNIMLFQKKLTLQELVMLSQCEHFDVIINCDMNVYKTEWKESLQALLNAGSFAFIFLPYEVPYRQSVRSFLLNLKDKRTQVLKAGSSTIMFVECHKNFLEKKWWGKRKLERRGNYAILSTFKQKCIKKNVKCIKNNKKTRCKKTNVWVHGINLATFYLLGGAYPLREDIANDLQALKAIPHSDSSMTNIVIQGKKLIFIDFDRETSMTSPKLNSVIAAFQGKKIAYNEPLAGYIRYRLV